MHTAWATHTRLSTKVRGERDEMRRLLLGVAVCVILRQRSELRLFKEGFRQRCLFSEGLHFFDALYFW